MKINQNLYPKTGGYRFQEGDGTVFVGASWPAVAARVRDYRRRNKLPAGDPEKEVNDQACARNPDLCRPTNSQHPTLLKVAGIKAKVLGWLGKQVATKEPRNYVSAEEAKARADVCSTCVNNKGLPDGCSSCRAAVRELRKSVIGGRKADARISECGCIAIGHENSTAVWLDEVRIANPDLPAQCWRKIQ